MKMTFAEAALAYELLQDGGTYRSIAPWFGISRERLRQIIQDCLIHGHDARCVQTEYSGKPSLFSIATLRQARELRCQGLSWKTVAKQLDVDHEQLRRAHAYADRPRSQHMNRVTEPRTPAKLKEENRALRGVLAAAKAALERSEEERAMLERRLSTAADKQILLLNKLINRDNAVHLNSADILPPVECPLLVELAPGKLVNAERTAFVEHRGNDLTYKVSDGNVICGKFRWTYP